jgi:toxin ParE1/3/4
MPYKVLLTGSAARDLEDLDAYITENDSPAAADHVLGKIEEMVATLTEFPERGTYPQELSSLGIREYREIFFKPYRIVYRVSKQTVYIYLITDGRRDMEALLRRRLLDK